MKKNLLITTVIFTHFSLFGDVETEKANNLTDSNLIQVALLLDTSGSMKGLIDQAKCQLWNVISDLEKAKSEGRVKKIGVSVYSPEQAKKILENYDIDIIQIPFNLLDQRFKESGLLEIFQTFILLTNG